jgi:hypothetical protein
VSVVCSGCLKTVIERPSHTAPDGRMTVVALHFPGEVVHPARGRRGQVRHIAVEPAVIRTAPSDLPVGSAMWRSAWMASVERAEQDCVRIASLASQPPVERLAGMLIDLHRRSGFAQLGNVLHLRLGREDLAAYLGIKPETVSRAFRQLQDLGLISRRGWRKISFLDLPELSGLAKLGE